jgi:HAD superfamily hydrolase (TIGR01509 family)
MSVNSSILQRKHWIFDLDGTLTVAVHDFAAIRKELGISADLPIIKTIKSLPENESILLQNKLHAIEEKLARNAKPALGVTNLLETLRRGDYSLGILTLNTRENAWFTLEALSLAQYFSEEFVIGRWCEEPKPSPNGIHKMLKQWKVTANDALMVGDFLYDLQVGRAAETATVHVDPSGEFAWPELADIQVNSLDELAGLLPK